MSSVVFDIETLGYPLETFDEVQQEYLLKFADTEEKRSAEIQKLSLHALTAQIIAVAMFNPDSQSGKVLFQSEAHEQSFSDDKKIEFSSGDEPHILKNFWDSVRRYDRF